MVLAQDYIKSADVALETRLMLDASQERVQRKEEYGNGPVVVFDVFDRIILSRSYELSRSNGTHYTKRVVDAYIRKQHPTAKRLAEPAEDSYLPRYSL